MTATCITTGKRAYSSREQARRRSRHIGARLRIYRCEHCKRWHVSNAEKR